MILFKPIRPKRLQDAVFRMTLLNAIIQVGKEIKADFERTASTWEHKPEFEVVVGYKHGPEVFVWTDDEIYNYVSGGTEEHIILPVDAQALRFREGFISKTKPGSLISIAGAQFGKVVFAAGVIHPGTEPREFDKLMKQKWERRFKTRMEKAMKEATKKCGHGM